VISLAIEKKFIKKALNDLQISGFLGKELERAGVSTIEVQKTPIATRITITVRRPGLVVGKRGKTIKDLCDELTRRFGMENPQIEVVEVANPSLDAKLMAERVGKRIEMRPHAKAAMRISLREIMEAGAIGAEIRVAGKIVGKGGKAKAFKVKAGYIKKSGDMMKSVNVGTYIARLKAGCVGVTVKIVPPNTLFADQYHAPDVVAPVVVEAEAELPPEAPAEEPAVEQKMDEIKAVEGEAKEASAGTKKKTAAKPQKKKVEKHGDSEKTSA